MQAANLLHVRMVLRLEPIFKLNLLNSEYEKVYIMADS